MRGEPRRTGERAPESLLDESRFAVPALPGFHVPRPRLVEQFDRSELGLVVLVSGPAGTGKTTAVAEWVRSTEPRGLGWVSFENDDVTFWGHLLPCLRRLGVEVPEQWLPPADAGLGRERILTLSELIGAQPERLTIVLDGYELVSRELGDELDFLVRHTRGRLRVVFVGRVDPVFPFYRHAIADALDEVRAADLAFSDAEAAELLRSAGLSMGQGAVHELNERLQGWAAGLRLTARALAGRPDPEGLLGNVVLRTAALTEFLIEEVLNRQPAALRRIVLDTSVPDVLCPGLVEEIAGRAAPRAFDSFAELKSLVEPESDHPGWFRYPPFVRDLLRAQLAYESPERVLEVHRASARWLAGAGLTVEALTHLSRASAWDEVAGAVVDGLLVGRLLVEGAKGPVAVLSRGVPADLTGQAAALVRGAVALVSGDAGRCDRELASVRSALSGRDPQPLGLSLAVVEAARASRAEDAVTAAQAVAAAERWLDEGLVRTTPDITDELTAVVQLSKGTVELRNGRLTAAAEALARVAEREPAGAAATFRAERAGRLAVVEALKGDLSRAVQSATDALGFAGEAGVPTAEAPPAAHVALALVGVDRAELDLTRLHVEAAAGSALLKTDPTCGGLAAVAEAALERADGDLEAAISRLMDVAGSAAVHDPWLADHLLLEAAAMRLADGQPEAALTTLERARDGDRPEVAVLAAAAYEEQGASLAVDGLLSVARRDDLPLRWWVSGLLVETVHRARQRSPGRARQTLDQALYPARAERLRRPFLDAPPSVRRWLEADPHFAHGSTWLDVPTDGPQAPEENGETRAAVVVEPLTAKELEILELLAALLTTEEVAEKLFVSVNTVRTHIRSILRKLGVGRRNAAIRRARELNIIDG